MASSNFNTQFTPFCAKWDEAYKKNFEKYNNQVLSIEKKLASKKLGSRYPFFFQRTIIELELNSQMSQIGQIFEEEYEHYSKINPDVRSDFKAAFQSTFALPIIGLAASAMLGAALSFVPVIKAIHPMKYSMLVIPPAAQYVFDHGSTAQQFRAKEFLNWVLAFREAQSRLEFEGKLLYERNPLILKRLRYYTLNRTSPYDIYEKMITLIREEIPENDTGSIVSFI